MSLTIGKRSTKVSRKSTVKITVDEDIKTVTKFLIYIGGLGHSFGL